MSSKYYKGDLDLIGADENHLIQLTDGQLIKSYDTETVNSSSISAEMQVLT